MKTIVVRHRRLTLTALALASTAALGVGCSAPGGSMSDQIQPAAHITNVTTPDPKTVTQSDTAASPVKVTLPWELKPLGSGQAVLGCPDGYTPQHDGAGFPNSGSSNSAISATPAGFTNSAVTLWVTNWNPFKKETTTLYIWCNAD